MANLNFYRATYARNAADTMNVGVPVLATLTALAGVASGGSGPAAARIAGGDILGGLGLAGWQNHYNNYVKAIDARLEYLDLQEAGICP